MGKVLRGVFAKFLTPILHHHNRVHTRGSGSSVSIEGDDVTKSWLERRLCLIFGCVGSLIVLTIVLLIIVVILVIRLNQAGGTTQQAMATAQKELVDFKTSMQDPIKKLNELSFKLDNNPFIPKLSPPQPATPQEKLDTPPVNASIHFPTTNVRKAPFSHLPKYIWSGCDRTCDSQRFKTPPLVLLSLDGFAAKYLEKRIVKSLEKFSECGVKAEKVYPSFPSKTFPNHYTMVTGLWPESHGIVDNEVYDPFVSPKVESMKSTSHSEFFQGEPIWSVYRRKTGKKANCFMYPGCAFNNSGFGPNVAPPYDKTVPLRYRLDTIIDWLKGEDYPGLITAYFSEPDGAGHYKTSEEDIDNVLRTLDVELDRFLTKLNAEKLLDCINLVISSDHGMQELKNRIYLDDFIKQDDVIEVNGVIGKIYLNGTETKIDDLKDIFTCRPGLNIKANTKKSIPVRKHFSRRPSVGDLILEGAPGTTFYVNRESEYRIEGDHGFDYLLPNMHAIFTARGPSFKKNVTIPPYQNVQYMNLWIDLLDIDEYVPNNGTIGFFDEILTNPRKRERNALEKPRECQVVGLPAAVACDACNEQILHHITMKMALCVFHNPPIHIASDAYCAQVFCDTVVLKGHRNQIILMEPMIHEREKNIENCTFSNQKYGSDCRQIKSDLMDFAISVRNQSVFTSQSILHFHAAQNFTKAHNAIQEKSLSYLKNYGSLYTISGVTVDADYDGVADGETDNPPTHFYRIIIACLSTWLNLADLQCVNSELQAIAFIFPLEDFGSMECVTDEELLLEYTATIHDVSRIAGFEFWINSMSPQDNIHLNRNITESLL